MSKNYAVIIQFVLPLTTFYRARAQRSDVYKRDAFVTSWRFHNRAWQPRRHDRLSETSGTLWIHRGALTNQRCSLATGCGINNSIMYVRKLRSISRWSWIFICQSEMWRHGKQQRMIINMCNYLWISIIQLHGYPIIGLWISIIQLWKFVI